MHIIYWILSREKYIYGGARVCTRYCVCVCGQGLLTFGQLPAYTNTKQDSTI
jgi:hypothetical protein